MDLEEKVEKPDWKQWLPVYGTNQAIKDYNAGKPVLGEEDTNRDFFWNLYQISTSVLVGKLVVGTAVFTPIVVLDTILKYFGN
ncbi:hypothetical protein HY495_02785 [Candidatus Woesearchaeota archaeon]|nr:hypothetical protein [Candidatus Woesearchaeota archaeon]